jgi:hypothetical protein
MSAGIAKVRNYHPGEFIYGRKILNEETVDVFLTDVEVESAERGLVDDNGNVVLEIEVDGCIELVIVQSIDLEWR